jgi:hypothetical protein
MLLGWYTCTLVISCTMVYHGTIVPPQNHDELYRGFGGGTVVPWYTMAQMITVVKIYHHKNHGTIYQGNLRGELYPGGIYLGLWGGTIVPWYTMVQLSTMVQKYHPKNLGTSDLGSSVVNCNMVFGVVQLYLALPWYN